VKFISGNILGYRWYNGFFSKERGSRERILVGVGGGIFMSAGVGLDIKICKTQS